MIGLDAGSGKGPSSIVMARYLNEIYSFEYDQENVEIQKLNIKNLKLNRSKKISNKTKINVISIN